MNFQWGSDENNSQTQTEETANWHQHMQTLGFCLGKLKNFALFCFFFVLSFTKECPGKFQ